jgi:hypothetical protein
MTEREGGAEQRRHKGMDGRMSEPESHIANRNAVDEWRRADNETSFLGRTIGGSTPRVRRRGAGESKEGFMWTPSGCALWRCRQRSQCL